MRITGRPVAACAVALLAGLVPGIHAANREFSMFKTPQYGYCQARLDCEPGSTACDKTGLSVSCSVDCHNNCEGVGNFTSALGPWTFHSQTYWSFGDYLQSVTEIGVQGQRLSDESFAVSGSYSRPPGGALELAVVRYPALASDLDGLKFGSVYDLVNLGVIEPEDVLFVENDFVTTGDPDDGMALPYYFEVDVTGLPDDQIAVLASGIGIEMPFCEPLCVPALGPLAAVVLGLSLIALSWRRARGGPAA